MYHSTWLDSEQCIQAFDNYVISSIKKTEDFISSSIGSKVDLGKPVKFCSNSESRRKLDTLNEKRFLEFLQNIYKPNGDIFLKPTIEGCSKIPDYCLYDAGDFLFVEVTTSLRSSITNYPQKLNQILELENLLDDRFVSFFREDQEIIQQEYNVDLGL